MLIKENIEKIENVKYFRVPFRLFCLFKTSEEFSKINLSTHFHLLIRVRIKSETNCVFEFSHKIKINKRKARSENRFYQLCKAVRF